MNRFGMNETRTNPRYPDDDPSTMSDMTRAYLFFWDKGRRVPADLAARLIEQGHDVEALLLPTQSHETQPTRPASAFLQPTRSHPQQDPQQLSEGSQWSESGTPRPY